MKNAVRVLVLSVAAGLATPAWAATDLQNHAVALTGRSDQYGPGFSAFGINTFGQFAHATINNAGQVAFGSSNSAYSSFQGLPAATSVFLYRPGIGLELVARAEGNAAPFVVVTNPLLSENGSVAFYGFPTGGNNGFHYRAIGQSTTTLAQLGAAANTSPSVAGASYQSLTTYGSFMFRGGNLAFGGTFSGSGINGANDDFLARSAGGSSPTLLARDGASGANPLGTDNGSRTWGTNFVPMAVNGNGDVAFLSGFTGGQFGEPTMFGKISALTGDVTTYAVSGGTVPTVGGAYTFIQGSGRVGLNDAGDAVFMGRSGTPQPNVLLRNVGGVTQFLAKTGDTIDGVTLTGFSSSRDPVITGNTTTLFAANVGSTGSFGIFRHTDGGGFEELLETGNVAKGPGDGLRFVDLSQISANASGDFAFRAQLAGTGVTSNNDEALFAYRGGQLDLIAREGSLFDVDPTAGVDLRTIYQIVTDTQLINTGGQDGRRGNMNDNGDVVFSLLFQTAPQTFSGGVFINSVPEPATVSVLGLVAAGLLRRPRGSGAHGQR